MLFYYPSGLSPDLQSMEQIRRIMRPTDVPDQGSYLLQSLFMESCVDMSCFFYFCCLALVCLFHLNYVYSTLSFFLSFSLRVPLFLSTPFSLSLYPFSSLLLPPPLSFSFPQVYSVISSGLIPIKRPSLGARMTEVYPSRLGQRLYQSSFANTTWI